MKKTISALVPVAAALALAMAFAVPAGAQSSGGDSFQATLKPLNGSGASGSFTVALNGDQATITGHTSGLASTFKGMPYPHVQHIHIAGEGHCPTQSADTNGDGIVDTVEGRPAYGMIGTTLSVSGDTSKAAGTNIKIAPGGASYDYSRTFTLDQASLQSVQSGTGVVVVHGLDPSTLSQTAQSEKSKLVPSLPIAATAPALCGTLQVSQMGAVPSGGVSTGGGSTAGLEDTTLMAFGAGMLLAAGAVLVVRRRRTTSEARS